MSDPRDAEEQASDQELSASPDQIEDLDDVEVEVEDAERVKGGRLEDPCGGGQIENR
jgi:hypothetical protein